MDELLGKKLLTKVGGPQKDTLELLKNKNLVLLYFSASWCPPCKAFSPLLVTFYEETTSEKIEIIYVSSDRTIPDFEGYYKKMPWLAIPSESGSAQVKQNLATLLGIQGIPTLVVLDAKTGDFISASARDEVAKVSGNAEAGKALIAKWKEMERKPISEAAKEVGGGGNIIMSFISWFLKNPMSIFAIMYAYRYLKKMYLKNELEDEGGMAGDVPNIGDAADETEF